uniref:Uncharacterized protein n=1 Tax=Oryza punctata TaxID=4537 RepID=A0A0E0L189_ORYPU
MNLSKRVFMNFLNQGSPSQYFSKNSSHTQFLSTLAITILAFSQSAKITQSSPSNFQTFHHFDPPTNYHLYGSSSSILCGFQQQAIGCTHQINLSVLPLLMNQNQPYKTRREQRELKDPPKWRRILEEDSNNKRTKIFESGTYTSSSNQDIEEETSRKEKLPKG